MAAIKARPSRREAERLFEVSPASPVRLHKCFVQEGRTQAKPIGSDQRPRASEPRAALIRQIYEAQPRRGQDRRDHKQAYDFVEPPTHDESKLRMLNIVNQFT